MLRKRTMKEQKNIESLYKLMISGSRGIKDSKKIYDELEKIFAAHPDFILISGEARGVDSIAEEWAKSRNLPIEQHKPDWAKYGWGAGIIRNKEMVLAADFVLIFWDGKSKGTKSVIDFCEKQGKPYKLSQVALMPHENN